MRCKWGVIVVTTKRGGVGGKNQPFDFRTSGTGQLDNVLSN
jgi:hypothetical protein